VAILTDDVWRWARGEIGLDLCNRDTRFLVRIFRYSRVMSSGVIPGVQQSDAGFIVLRRADGWPHPSLAATSDQGKSIRGPPLPID
jgi:hypothetical protein